MALKALVAASYLVVLPSRKKVQLWREEGGREEGGGGLRVCVIKRYEESDTIF